MIQLPSKFNKKSSLLSAIAFYNQCQHLISKLILNRKFKTFFSLFLEIISLSDKICMGKYLSSLRSKYQFRKEGEKIRTLLFPIIHQLIINNLTSLLVNITS